MARVGLPLTSRSYALAGIASAADMGWERPDEDALTCQLGAPKVNGLFQGAQVGEHVGNLLLVAESPETHGCAGDDVTRPAKKRCEVLL